MIEFRKLEVEGYGSIISPTKIKLHRPGVNIVIGEVGSGKTTMFSPLRWVISGKTLKGTKDPSTWPHLRPKDYTGPKVTLFFKKDGKKYELTRATKGRKQTLTLKDEEGNNLLKDNKLKNQETIFEFLGFNDEVLVNSIIFGQRMKRIIESSGPDKKRLFEEAFNAGFLKEGRDSAKVDLDIEKANLSELEHEQELLQTKYKGKKDLKAQVKSQIDNFETQLEAEKADIKKRLSNTSYSVKYSVKGAQEKIEKLSKSRDRLKNKLYQEQNDAQALAREIRLNKNNLKKARDEKKYFEAELDKLDADTKKVNDRICQYCGTKLNDVKQAKAIKEIEKRREVLDTKLYSLETHILRFAAEAEKLENRSKKSETSRLSTYQTKIKNYEIKIKELHSEISDHKVNKGRFESLKTDLLKLENKIPPTFPKGLKKEIKTLKEQIKRNNKVIKTLTKAVENISWVYNDLLGNKGLKSYIFDTMLAQLNKLLAYYEQFIGFKVEFRVDLDSGNKDIFTICYRDGELIYYEDLSGGQKQLVDAVTTFALYELITQDKPTNLMILDEPFEGLSESASELIYELIQDKNKNNKSIFIITHNINLQHSSDKIIRVGIIDGETKLKIL